MYICICKAVTEIQVRSAVESGLSAPADLISALQLDDPANCGRCLERADQLLDLPCVRQVLQRPAAAPELPRVAV